LKEQNILRMRKRYSESTIIEKLENKLSDPKINPHGFRDDVAYIDFLKDGHVITTDTMVENIHYLKNLPPADIAHRLMACNLSDLASKGAKPLYYFLNLSLSPAIDDKWIDGFINGLEKMQKKYAFTLMGGDTVSGVKTTMLSATFIGQPLINPPPMRMGARAGDVLYVTGTIGDAYLGLKLLENKAPKTLMDILSDDDIRYFKGRYSTPIPRLDWAQKIHAFLGADLHAMMDISDGLLIDSEKMARASQVHINVNFDAIPFYKKIHELTRRNNRLLRHLISGGDDYELLYAINADICDEFDAEMQRMNIPCKKIGGVKQKISDCTPHVKYISYDGDLAKKNGDIIYKGYEHC
jgi:thiamine-monophosphate kinase